jgi:putative SOS response-associated peptidase YedK
VGTDFALITVEAKAVIAPVHDRMLAILDHSELGRWLSTEEDLRDLLRPYAAEYLEVSLAKGTKRHRPRGTLLSSQEARVRGRR